MNVSWLGKAAVATGAGVLAGTAGGPMGMALGGLVGLARSLTSQPHAEAEAPALAQAAEAVTGLADEAQAASAILADPIKAEAFRLEALDIRAKAQAARDAHLLAMLQADAADRANARAADAQRTGPLRYATLGICIFLLSLYATIVGLIMYGLPTPPPDDMATLRALAIAAAFYWTGSSRGSAAKDERKSDAAEQERR